MRQLPQSKEDLSFELHQRVARAAAEVMEGRINLSPPDIQVMSIVAALWVILKDTSYTADYLTRLAAALHGNRTHLVPLPSLYSDKIQSRAKDRVAISGGAVQVMDAIQGTPADIQLMAYATLLWKIDTDTDNSFTDLLEQVDNLSKDAVHSERVDHRFAGLKFYFRRHLKDKL